MTDLVSTLFSGTWGLIMDIKPFGIPVIYPLLIVSVLGVLMKFLKGKK